MDYPDIRDFIAQLTAQQSLLFRDANDAMKLAEEAAPNAEPGKYVLAAAYQMSLEMIVAYHNWLVASQESSPDQDS